MNILSTYDMCYSINRRSAMRLNQKIKDGSNVRLNNFALYEEQNSLENRIKIL